MLTAYGKTSAQILQQEKKRTDFYLSISERTLINACTACLACDYSRSRFFLRLQHDDFASIVVLATN